MTTMLHQLQRKYNAILPHLDERARRIWGATEAREIGRNGVTLVATATGMSRTTIYAGQRDLEQQERTQASPGGRGPVTNEQASDEPASDVSEEPRRIRKPGGGRKTVAHHHPDFLSALEGLVEPLTRGDPESPLRWTCKSTRTLADELKRQNIPVGRQTVDTSLHHLGYSLQGNRKTREGQQHPDRNEQFEQINRRAAEALASKSPLISVDTKKKELIGNYKNNGQDWHPKDGAPRVNSHDFPGPDVPRAFPFGVYDIGCNKALVNVGTDHDTSAFAVASIRAWWETIGSAAYPGASYIQIMADSGGSNGYRRRAWKWELQLLADQTGLPIRVCHFPPGTSKWNKIEHRLFSYISRNWRGRPLDSYETIVNLIAATTTRTGLTVRCELDLRSYPLGQKVSNKDWATLALHPDEFHGEWNYEIRPRNK